MKKILIVANAVFGFVLLASALIAFFVLTWFILFDDKYENNHKSDLIKILCCIAAGVIPLSLYGISYFKRSLEGTNKEEIFVSAGPNEWFVQIAKCTNLTYGANGIIATFSPVISYVKMSKNPLQPEWAPLPLNIQRTEDLGTTIDESTCFLIKGGLVFDVTDICAGWKGKRLQQVTYSIQEFFESQFTLQTKILFHLPPELETPYRDVMDRMKFEANS